MMTAFTLAMAVLMGAQANHALTLGPAQDIVMPADQIVWMNGPASLASGSQMVVLEGDPAVAGMFTMRLKFPDGYSIAPHWHPNFERVTVLSGTMHLGHGEVLDPDTTTELAQGSYAVMPPEMRHYAIFEGETVIQINTIGPWAINYVNPADDPRN